MSPALCRARLHFGAGMPYANALAQGHNFDETKKGSVAAMSDELNVGSRAPEFKLPANDGREISLVDYRDKALVVLFFVREYN